MILPLKRYADFSGRSRRTEFWMFYLFQIIVIVAVLSVAAIFAIIASARGSDSTQSIGVGIIIGSILFLIVLVALIIPQLAVLVRRLHDQDLSGWIALIAFVPLVGLVVLVMMFIEGTRGPNRYGEDPKAPAHSRVFS